MILFDLSNIFYRSLFKLENAIKTEEEKYGVSSIKIDANSLLKAILLEVRYNQDKFKYDYGHVVLCCDSHSNWRYKYFKEYKQGRKVSKANDERDWDFIMNEYDKVKQMIADNTEYIVLQIDDLEADDIIALSCKNTQSNTVIVSVDKDLNQLVDNNRIKQYSPLQRDFITREHHPLNEAILTGDASDGVPNIFSDDNHFVKEEKTRAKAISSKIKEYFNQFEVITEENVSNFVDEYNNKAKDDAKLNKDTIIHNFKRNKLMIDLGCVPEEYIDIYKQAMKEGYEKSLLHKDTSNSWIDSIIGTVEESKEDQKDLEIGDLFD